MSDWLPTTVTNAGRRVGRYVFLTCACVAFAVALGGCAGATRSGASSSSVPPSERVVTVSATLGPIDPDDYPVLRFGDAPRGAELREVTGAIRHYYALAEAGDARRACEQLYPVSVDMVLEEEHRPPEHAGCEAGISELFRRHHAQLLADRTSLRIALIRVNSVEAVALLRVKTSKTAREFVLRRVGGGWQVYSPLDSPLR